MSVKERDFIKGAPPATAGEKASAWMGRLNDFGERHATAIIAASTVLTILTVILFASYFYNRSQNEKAEAELAEAKSVEKLKELKAKFGGTPAGPRILFKLAGEYADEGQLEEAKKEYQEFQTRYPNDPLRERVLRGIQALDKNIAFQTEQRERRMKETKLQTHPRLLSESKDPRLEWGPSLKRPTVELEVGTGTGKVVLELYETEAPRSVAAFLKWVDEKYFDGIKLDTKDERLVTQPKADKPIDAVPYEATPRPGDAGSVVLVRKEGATENLGGQFQILLKESPDLKDTTIIGVVKEGLNTLKALKKDDIIKTARVVGKKEEAKSQSPAPKPQ